MDPSVTFLLNFLLCLLTVLLFLCIVIGQLQVGDGHPIRLWRVSVEIEAPPTVVLHRVLRERHLWDEDLLHSRVMESLENNTEVFHYITDSMAPHPRRDFVVLRYTRAHTHSHSHTLCFMVMCLSCVCVSDVGAQISLEGGVSSSPPLSITAMCSWRRG